MEFRWATTEGAHSMPAIEELEYLGYVVVRRDGEIVVDPRYRTVLMRRDG